MYVNEDGISEAEKARTIAGRRSMIQSSFRKVEIATFTSISRQNGKSSVSRDGISNSRECLKLFFNMQVSLSIPLYSETCPKLCFENELSNFAKNFCIQMKSQLL